MSNTTRQIEMLVTPFPRRPHLACGLVLMVGLQMPWEHTAWSTCSTAYAQQRGEMTARRGAAGSPYVPQNNLFQLPSVAVALGRLNQPAGFRWEQKELRGALHELSQNARVTIWIDRRVDPNTKIDYRPSAATTIYQALESIAKRIGGSVGLVENVVYVGPAPESAALVQAGAVRMHDSLTLAKHSSSTELRKLSWNRVTTPAQILSGIAADWRTQIEGEVPYDLWHAMDLGTCSLATQLTLVLAGFDLQPSLRRSTIGVTPLAREDSWQYTYPATMLSPESSSRRGRLALLSKYGGSVRQQGNSFLVTGPSNLHLELLRPVRAAQAMQQNLESRIVSLEVIKEFGPLMDELAASIGFELTWSDELNEDLRRRRVEFSVKQVTVDQLLQKCAESAGVRVERKGSTVTVSPR
ncbi:MAG: hypothetical protein AAGG44_09875 [Planctomycetota bacterium]